MIFRADNKENSMITHQSLNDEIQIDIKADLLIIQIIAKWIH